MPKLLVPAVAALLLAIPASSPAQQAKEAAPKPAKPSIYDVHADAREQVKVATAVAGRDAKRVLVMFGGDWCGWCHKLHGLFKSDPAIRKTLGDEYELVMVDTKAPHADDLLKECKQDLAQVGYPFLAVLDAKGKVVTHQETDALEEGDHHDPAKVKAFLDKWAPTKVAASKAFEDGLAKASSEDKLVFLHFGAPWCGWCHKLEDFLAREDVAPVMGREFVDVKLDTERMTGTEEILKKYHSGPSGGIPWFAFLDPSGKKIVDSDGPKGNVGYPAAAEEIDHFVGMLKKAARKLTPADVESIESKLRAEGKKIEDARAARAPH